MIYRSFRGKELSMLGFGTMRLPVVNGEYGRIDEAATAEMVEYALAHGINYFDTAFGYHEGHSESVIGKILSRYPSDSYYLASKFPGFDLDKVRRVEEIFETQLQKCCVDHFDFYLFHNVCDLNIEWYLDEQYGIFRYLVEQKRRGRIHHLGFSCHGDAAMLKRFLNAYGSELEFCQIQLNWLDWKLQDAEEKVNLLNRYGIPIWVMEPLRGGRLVSLTQEDEAKLTALRPQENLPMWGFRFLQSVPGVTMILSGMSDMAQLVDNVRIFSADRPLDEADRQTLFSIADGMISVGTLGCTNCRYCTEKCPQELDIPALLRIFNRHRFVGSGTIDRAALAKIEAGKTPAACVGCGSCESVCPQKIAISETMRDFVHRLID